MKISQLIEALSRFPADLEVAIDLPQGLTEPDVELRDIQWSDGRWETVLNVRQSHYGSRIGYAHLTDEERATTRRVILDGLADARRPWKFGARRYTHIHGDHRLYSDFGRGGDSCYGTGYDPRLFAELEAEGLIICDRANYRVDYSITDAGMAALGDSAELE